MELRDLTEDSRGNLYGTNQDGGTFGGATVFKVDSRRGAESTLHTFLSFFGDGYSPRAGVTLDSSGNIYGTTSAGGLFNYGTVFALNSSLQETLLRNFTGGEDGAIPLGALLFASDGGLYGTTGQSDTKYGCCRGVAFNLAQ